MRLPRDVSGEHLAGLLRRHYGYQLVRQRGSHMTVTATIRGAQHSVTIPRHRQLRAGTLSFILSDVAKHMQISHDEIRQQLFGR